ncbi:MAG: hypothetical protein ALECFALPRED_008654 [Alectoria fallacina]|uniref:Uncharacterized protein n=1 Tax=Alectoria fallacina TaxID=1903189 RepID=A0A8H3ICB7_9LECA|nr:MAG: hypothetical protein ALECFALPRED_008654 [Alectoria fallacina]
MEHRPTRFYNTLNPSVLLQLKMLTPMGGPLLRPAARESRGQHTDEFRNFIWVPVPRLVLAVDDQEWRADPEMAEITRSVSARRPTYLLDLTPVEHDPETTRDTDTWASSAASSSQAALAAVWQSLSRAPTSYCSSSHCSPTTEAAEEMRSKDDIQMLELSRERDADDFMLIRGSELLLRQFSHHYGHPLRDGNGFLASDRANEVVSVALVSVLAMVFPVSLVASIWADQDIQRIWLDYEAYATIAMYAFRFRGGELVGSTETMFAGELEKGKKVALMGDDGKGVMASMQCWTAKSVAEAQEKVEKLLKEWE